MTESTLRALFLLREAVAGLPAVDAGAVQRPVPTWRLRSGLLAGCAMAVGLAGYLGDPAAFTHADPALGRLLRGMALIKGLIAIAVVAAVWWRFGRPVSKAVAAGYLLGTAVLVGSTTLVWQLSWIPLAAVLFHASAVSMLVLSWRER